MTVLKSTGQERLGNKKVSWCDTLSPCEEEIYRRDFVSGLTVNGKENMSDQVECGGGREQY